MNENLPSGVPDVTSHGGASDATSSQAAEEMVSKKSIEKIVQNRLKNSSSKIAELERELAQYRGETNDDEKADKPSANPLEAEYKSKLQRADREKKALLEKLDRHRQSTLRAQVQQKLIEKDCIDPDLAFIDLRERGLVKLNDSDEVEVGGVYNDLDELVDEYLTKREYLKRSKAVGGIGSKAGGVNIASGDFNKSKLIEQVKAAKETGNKLFGHNRP